MTKGEAAQLKRTGVWFNAVAAAWNMGEAPWTYANANGGSFIVVVWNDAYNDRSLLGATEEERLTKAADAVEGLCKQLGIDLKRHRSGKMK